MVQILSQFPYLTVLIVQERDRSWCQSVHVVCWLGAPEPLMHKAPVMFKSNVFSVCMISESSKIKRTEQNMPSFLTTLSSVLPHCASCRSNRLSHKRTKLLKNPKSYINTWDREDRKAYLMMNWAYCSPLCFSQLLLLGLFSSSRRINNKFGAYWGRIPAHWCCL